MTICNMSIEAGARAGLIAPDEKTYNYIQGRPYAKKVKNGKKRQYPTGKPYHQIEIQFMKKK